jgi:hypothetical protein
MELFNYFEIPNFDQEKLQYNGTTLPRSTNCYIPVITCQSGVTVIIVHVWCCSGSFESTNTLP